MKKYKDRDSYISYCLTLDGDTLRDALQDLCKEAGVADCTVFLSAGGLPYTLRYLTSQIYLNNKPINHCVRAKANILNIIHDAHLEEMSSSNYYSLKRLYKQSDNSYYKEKYKGMLIKLETMIREEVNAFLGNEIKCRKCGAILGPLWHGWADVGELMKKSREYGVNFDLDMLDFVVKTNNKKRFAFNDSKTKIRASQGHSIDVDLCLQQQVPPEFLFHGTSIDSVNSIMSTGLNKGKRNHVHLSKDVDTAIKVGMRHGKPVVFRVLAANMVATGKYVYYLSENGVWLTNNVPPEFLELKEVPTK